MSHEIEEDPASLKVLQLSRDVQELSEQRGWYVSEVLNKSMEELGEFSEAVQISRGIITNKVGEEFDVIEEGADVIACVLDVIQRMYPTFTPERIHKLLSSYLLRKTVGWVDDLHGRPGLKEC